MAIRTNLFGVDVLVKTSGNRAYLSRMPSDIGSEKQMQIRKRFAEAVATCKSMSKTKDNIYESSPFNACVKGELEGNLAVEEEIVE